MTRPPPKGCIVLCYSGRKARVMGYTEEGRAMLRYTDNTGPGQDTVDLWPRDILRIHVAFIERNAQAYSVVAAEAKQCIARARR